MPGRLEHLKIWQQNVNKSMDAQQVMLHRLLDDNDPYDIIAIQEPCIDFLKLTRALPHWRVVYPHRHHDTTARVRSVTLVSDRLSTNAWAAIPLGSMDVTALSLDCGDTVLLLYNIYLDQHNDQALHAMANSTAKKQAAAARQGKNCEVIWLGDFNRHHPAWDEERNHHLFTAAACQRAQTLLDRLQRFHMEMALAQGVPTLRAMGSKNLTRPDNVFCTAGLTDVLISCRVHPERQPQNTDHFPIATAFDLTLETAHERPTRNFRMVDWDSFNGTLQEELEKRPPLERINTQAEFDRSLSTLNEALQAALNKEVPVKKKTPYAKPWYSKHLKAMATEVERLGKEADTYKLDLRHPAHRDYRRHRNKYNDAVKYAKKDHWDEWLDHVDKSSIWAAHRFMKKGSSDGGSARIPTINAKDQDGNPTLLTTNAQKGEEFFKTFFLPPGPPTEPPPDFEYPPPKFEFRPITNAQIDAAIRSLKSFKVPGPDGVPNEVYKHSRELLTPILGRLFRATFRLRYYPEAWKISTTVVLQKPGKPDYTVAKAYRPVALLNCMSKILSRCVADVLVYEAEQHSLLADFQFGGRPGRQCADSIHLVTKLIKDAWRSHEVASVLFLDIKSAFPAATPDRLFHNMRMRGVPTVIVDWLAEKLRGRKTILTFDDFISELYAIDSGIDQGCPLSVILYAFYNSDLLDSGDKKRKVTPVGSMDDVAVVAVAATTVLTHDKLRWYMTREGGAQTWSKEHNSAYSVDKSAVMNCSRKDKDVGPGLTLGDDISKSWNILASLSVS